MTLTRFQLITVSALLGASLCGDAANAQSDPEPDPDVARREAAELLVPRVPGEVEAFAPVDEAVTEPTRPGLTQGIDWLSALDTAWAEPGVPGLLPERTFVNRVRGRALRGPHETVVFVPEPIEAPLAAENGDPGAPPIPAALAPTMPMLVLPCGVLDRFTEYVLEDHAVLDVVLSGQIFLYGDRNYVMPTGLERARPGSVPPVQTIVPSEAAETPAELAEPAGSSDSALDEHIDEHSDTEPVSGHRGDILGDDPDVEAMMADLERRPPFGTPRPPVAAIDDADDASIPEPAFTVEDGVYISAQRGRVVRAKNGTWSFEIDNDEPSRLGRGVTEYTLLPCRALQGIERLALSSGDGDAGELSGRAYRFHNGWYLLPTLFQRDRRDGVDPLQ